MSRFTVEALPLERTYLGEGPHWDAKNQQLYYVDILAKAVNRYVPSTGAVHKAVIRKLILQ